MSNCFLFNKDLPKSCVQLHNKIIVQLCEAGPHPFPTGSNVENFFIMEWKLALALKYIGCHKPDQNILYGKKVKGCGVGA